MSSQTVVILVPAAPPTIPKCSVCRNEGHDRRTCGLLALAHAEVKRQAAIADAQIAAAEAARISAETAAAEAAALAASLAAARITYYRGSDNHSQPHCAFNGASALSKGEYVIGFGEGDKKPAAKDFLEHLTAEQAALVATHFRMSHTRWNEAKSMTSGDIVFMCKYENRKPHSISRGNVTSGPFFKVTKKPVEGYAGEVIMRWTVTWTLIGRASEIWLNYLQPSKQKTLYALDGAPPS